MTQIRRVVDGDFDAVHRLLEQLMPAARDLRWNLWRRTLAQDDFCGWIAEVEDRPAGFLDLYVFPDVGHGRNIGLINNVVVDAEFRRRGVAASLIKEAIAHCRLHDVAELHLWTEAGNAPALTLYERSGFVQRALLMELEM